MSATYRDAPLLKAPVWTWEIPLYFFVGGAAGAAGATPDDGRQPDRIIAFAGADVGDPHPLLDSGQLDHAAGLAEAVAGVLGREGIADNGSDRAVRFGETLLLRLGAARGEDEEEGESEYPPRPGEVAVRRTDGGGPEPCPTPPPPFTLR